MRFALVLAALGSMGCALAQTPQSPPFAQSSEVALSEPAAAMVAGVRSAIDQELARQGQRPAPQTEAEHLINLTAP
jgi:hypothetical protein